VDRIKRLSFEVLNDNNSKFGEDFVENKKALNQITIIRSKGLKNKVAGYITRYNKKQIREENFKNTRNEESSLDSTELNENSETVEEITLTNEEVESLQVKPIAKKLMKDESEIAEEDSILKEQSDNASEEKTE
jgi:small subunit ribosomal protein S17e